MKIYIKNLHKNKINFILDKINFIDNYLEADKYNLSQFIFLNEKIIYKTIYISKIWDIYCFDLDIIWNKFKKYFYIWNVSDNDIWYRVKYFFDNLYWIALKTLSCFSKIVKIDKKMILSLEKISSKEFISSSYLDNKIILNDFFIPNYLDVNDKLFNIYKILNKKLKEWSNIFFQDFILSLVNEKYWINSLFFLNSNLKFKVVNFFNKYDEIISLQIPVARSKFLEDLFESLLLQTDKNFKITIWIDWYDEKQKIDIIKICKKYKNKFEKFNYFVNKKNLWVWKTRWKLMKKDYNSKYVIFLDDDVFLDYKAIENLYKNIFSYKNMWIYSIENVDVRYDTDYKESIFMKSWFSQPGVFTNRNIINRLPIYVSQEETPIIFDRFYRDLLDLKYHKSFDKCSLDLFYNRTLEIICWNININWIYQFNRVWHRFHQTKEKWFLLKEYEYNLYILDKVTSLTNKNKTYDVLIKAQTLKQDELFDN